MNHFLDFLAALVPVLLFAGSVFFGFVSGMLFFFVVSTIFGFNSPCLMDSGYIGWIGMTMKRTSASVFLEGMSGWTRMPVLGSSPRLPFGRGK